MPLAAILLIPACSDEPDVVVVEPIRDEEVSFPTEGESEQSGWDADGDGLLGRGEFLTFGGMAFSRWDNDRDGSLTREEFASAWTDAGFSNPEEAFRFLDDDGSEVLRQRDLFNLQQWEQWDKDGSGILEEQEFSFY